MKSNKKNDKKESATQQLLNLKQFVPLQIGDNGAVAIEGEDGMLYTYIMLRPDNISGLGRSESRYFRKVLTRQRCTQRLLRGVVGQAIRIRRKHHERRSKLFFLPGKSQ